VIVKDCGGEGDIVGVLLGVLVGVVVEVGVGVKIDSGAIPTGKILFVGVFVEIGEATEV